MDSYDRLRERLDAHPTGAPASSYFNQILRILFSQEEAEAACYLTFVFQPISKLAEKTRKKEETLFEMFERMANRGVIMAKRASNGEPRYCLVPVIPGLFEFPFMRAERAPQKEELARLWQAYHTEILGNTFAGSKTPQMRVIPVQKSLTMISEVLIYEQVADMIGRAQDIAVTNCACRESVQGCDKPIEVCLSFDMGARFLVERDLARKIDKEEALRVLDIAEEAGLVHCINNSQDRPIVLCNCCGCCCTILRGITELHNPNAVATSSYMINFNENECSGCLLCLDNRCPVSAVQEKEDTVSVDESSCIGCGLCASVCPTGALVMRKREETPTTPPTYQQLYANIMQEKGTLEAFMKLNRE
ncbi:MAG: indolepyruvate ferredoxin oxidoreductase subunit alpha [Chitinophagales bacterium]